MIIQSRKVYYEEKFQEKQIEIKEDKIIGIYNYNQFKPNKDYKNLMILPGLCDINTHGYDGVSTTNPNKKWLKKWSQYMLNEGITSFIPSILSCPKDTMFKALNIIGKYIDSNNNNGAKILGTYIEGPFITKGKEKGALDAKYQLIPNKKIIDELVKHSNNHISCIMIAPEILDNDYSVIDYCSRLNIPVSIGHSSADFDVCKNAIKHGAKSFTHTYNGMTPLHHRQPGIVGAAMYFNNTYAELITDGIHVNKIAANVLSRIKGKDHLILITDSVALKGKEIGSSIKDEDGKELTICKDRICRFKDGGMCGSVKTLNKNLQFAIEEENIDYITAINAVTINPMKLLNINDRGLIKEGYLADVVIFDSNFDVKDIFINGKLKTINLL